MPTHPVVEAIEPYQPALSALLHQLAAERVVERLWARDPSLWHPAPSTQARISERLGWLDPTALHDPALAEWLAKLPATNVSDLVWLGADTAAASFRLWLQIATTQRRELQWTLLDTLEPHSVQQRLQKLNASRTAVVFAASELTPEVETLCEAALAALCWSRAVPPGRLLVLTQPDAAVLAWLQQRAAFEVLPVPGDVPDRFAALFAQGGLDLAKPAFVSAQVWEAVADMRRACRHPNLTTNPGVWLGALLAVLAQHGHDVLTLVAPPGLQPLAEWIALFVGGSLSKHRRGFVPVLDEPAREPAQLRPKRICVQLRTGEPSDAAFDAHTMRLARAGHPVVRFMVPTPVAAAAHVLCWQVAVAIAGVVLGLNPFDEPDTDALRAMLRVRMGRDASAVPPAALSVAAPDFSAVLRGFVAANRAASYVALVLYLARTPAVDRELTLLRAKLGLVSPATLVVEPWRDPLFATQVLHAGRSQGAIITLSAPPSHMGIAEPFQRLHELAHARRAVDAAAWRTAQRAVLHLQLGPDLPADIARCTAAVAANNVG